MEIKPLLKIWKKLKKLYEDGLAQGVKNAERSSGNNKKEALEKLNTTKTVLTGDAFKTYTTTYEAFIAAVDKSVDSWVAYLQANYSWAIQNSLVETLTSVAEAIQTGKMKSINLNRISTPIKRTLLP